MCFWKFRIHQEGELAGRSGQGTNRFLMDRIVSSPRSLTVTGYQSGTRFGSRPSGRQSVVADYIVRGVSLCRSAPYVPCQLTNESDRLQSVFLPCCTPISAHPLDMSSTNEMKRKCGFNGCANDRAMVGQSFFTVPRRKDPGRAKEWCRRAQVSLLPLLPSRYYVCVGLGLLLHRYGWFDQGISKRYNNPTEIGLPVGRSMGVYREGFQLTVTSQGQRSRSRGHGVTRSRSHPRAVCP